MRTVTRSVVLAFATGLTAGVIAGCQVYDFAPVRPLVITSVDREIPVIARASKPNLMLLVDKSESMDQPVDASNSNCPAGCGSFSQPRCPANCPTRWSELQSAMRTFLDSKGTVARMGLTTFPNATGLGGAAACGIAVDSTTNPVTYNTSATATLRVGVPAADEDSALQAAATAIRDEILTIQYVDSNTASTEDETAGGTPTGFSVNFVAQLPELNDTAREDLILLLTDGLPNCNPSNPNPDGGAGPCFNCLDPDGASARIADARQRGIRTIVVGFGADTAASESAAILNQMANSGGFPRECASDADCSSGDLCDGETQTVRGTCRNIRFYQAGNATELAAALEAIAGVINPQPCRFVLDQAPQDDDPRFVVVYITEPGQDQRKLLPGDNTWTYANDQGTPVVTLQGETCAIVSAATAANPVRVSIRVVRSF